MHGETIKFESYKCARRTVFHLTAKQITFCTHELLIVIFP